MKKGLIIGLALVIMMSLAAVSLAAPSTNATTASVAFTEAKLEFVDPGISGMNGMNINFGTHTFPLGYVEYYAEDGLGGQTGTHTLRVADPNDQTLKWEVTAELSVFKSVSAPANTFVGDIELKNPTLTISNNGSTGDFHFENTVLLEGDGAPVDVMSTGDDAFDPGYFDLTWGQADIMLSVVDAEAVKIVDPAYTAVITWTLEQTI